MARILLIEDDDGLRTILAEYLTLAGHTVREAGDGQEGLDLFRQAGTDLVVTDIVMPEKEGLAVLRELRSVRPPVKVIVISGGGLGSDVHLKVARLLGAAKVFLKPFPPAALLAAIDDLLSGDA